jgi:hypothetical protein
MFFISTFLKINLKLKNGQGKKIIRHQTMIQSHVDYAMKKVIIKLNACQESYKTIFNLEKQ